MTNYIDGFVFPIRSIYLEEYQNVAEKVAEIWKEFGATAYFEFVGDDMKLEGTKSFMEAVGTKEDEEIVFGWVVFPSKEVRDLANKKVPQDQRMADLVGPLVNPKKLIFDASRMVYGGFKPLVNSDG
ncbi:DUF1428 domain-containing protein [Flagellimonas algicola]|uniref:DUF1428 family protein n=1 Tax=Flagellimonas algicola TaxID=2583815 RepID=A0ABY2WPN8_9FLAO|nr:DUF1428 domain-containing protein [Allomuricauda algicola]TMU56616.1 DUF1428 family protein [Allomuricauda algicola]